MLATKAHEHPALPWNKKDARKQVESMLTEAPVAGTIQSEVWKSMTVLNATFLEQYWNWSQATQVDNGDDDTVEMLGEGVGFEELTGEEGNACAQDYFDAPARCFGTFKEGLKSGIVRVEWANGTVEEGTWLDG